MTERDEEEDNDAGHGIGQLGEGAFAQNFVQKNLEKKIKFNVEAFKHNDFVLGRQNLSQCRFWARKLKYINYTMMIGNRAPLNYCRNSLLLVLCTLFNQDVHLWPN